MFTHTPPPNICLYPLNFKFLEISLHPPKHTHARFALSALACIHNLFYFVVISVHFQATYSPKVSHVDPHRGEAVPLSDVQQELLESC